MNLKTFADKTFGFRLLPLLLVTLFAVLDPPGAGGQGVRPRDDIVTLRRIAGLPVRDQLLPANQGFLQDWFVDNVDFYMHLLEGSALWQSNLLSLGNLATYRTALAPPRGTDPNGLTITYENVPNPRTLGPRITFPTNNVTPSGGEVSTCWEEATHFLLGRRSLLTTQADCPLSYTGNNDQERQEHVYIDNVRKYVSWLRMVASFEPAVRESGLAAFKYLSTTSPADRKPVLSPSSVLPLITFDKMNFDVERQIWNRAHAVWNSSNWRTLEREICDFRPDLAEELESLTGIRILSRQAIRTFYMRGGVTTPNRLAVHVPEWVMLEEGNTLREILKIDSSNEKRETLPNELRHSFDVKIFEFYRVGAETAYRGNRNITRGNMTVKLVNGDDKTGLYLNLIDENRNRVKGFQTPARQNRGGYFEVDLYPEEGTLSRLGAFELIFSLLEPNMVREKRTYRIEVAFRDRNYPADPPGPAVYMEPSTAYFYVDVEPQPAAGVGGAAGAGATAKTGAAGGAAAGTGTATGTGTAGAGGGAPAVKTSASPSARGGKATWVLNKKWIEKHSNPPANTKFNWDVADEKFTFSSSRPPDPSLLDPGMECRDLVTWDPLPNKMVEDDAYFVKVKLNGSYKLASGKELNRSLDWTVFWATPLERQNNQSGSPIYWMPMTWATLKAVDSYNVKVWSEKPRNPSDTTMLMVIEVNEKVNSSRILYFHQYIKDATAAPAGPPQPPPAVVSTNLTVQTALPQPHDPRLDNVPEETKKGGPDAGGGKGAVGKKEDKPPKKEPAKADKNALDWYYHAQKGYRFRKTQGWSVGFNQPDSATDLLLPPDESMGLICGRGSGNAGSESAERVLDRLAAGIVQKNPGATTSSLTLGGAPAIRVDTFDSGKKSMFWHFYVLHGGRTYYLAVMMPPDTNRMPLPNQVMDMLKTMEFLK